MDIVTLANCILAANCSDLGRTDDASHAKLMLRDNTLVYEANGFVGGVQMTLSHGEDFSIELSDKVLYANYLTEGNETRLIIVTPETEKLFSYNGAFEIVEVIVANSQYEVSVDLSVVNHYSLSKAYPNPFNPVTNISYDLPERSRVQLSIFDITGRRIRLLVREDQPAGFRSVLWDGTDNSGRPVSGGVYFYQLHARDFVETRKMLLIK